MTDRTLERDLRRLEAPDEGEAALRAWQVASAEFEQLERVPVAPPKRRSLQRGLIGAAAAAGLAALVISPAGASVRHWVGDRFASTGVKHAQPALVSLPSGGHLLVSSRDGTWVVSADGSKRRLGPYRDPTWSPHGLFVAAVRGDDLVAVDPRGHVRWALPRLPRPELPSWSPGDGFRVAYLSGSTLRVVAGDGSGDRALARRVASVAAAWRPLPRRHVLSYWTRDGQIVTRDADSGRVLWRVSAPDPTPGTLQWSSTGSTLMVAGPRRLELLDGRSGAVLKLLTTGAGVRFDSAEIAPDGRTIALARSDNANGSSEVFVLRVGSRGWDARRVFGPGAGRFDAVRWSPNGRWLLVTWRDADQWLFLRSAPARRLVAVSRIGRAFEPDRGGVARFPAAGGWCCTP